MLHLHLAIEVKLAKKWHSASAIQEEIAADISAYHARWKQIMFVIYDLGEISDPYQLRHENMRIFGVSVIVKMNYLAAELRGIKTQVKPASYRLPYAASCGELDPKRLNTKS